MYNDNENNNQNQNQINTFIMPGINNNPVPNNNTENRQEKFIEPSQQIMNKFISSAQEPVENIPERKNVFIQSDNSYDNMNDTFNKTKTFIKQEEPVSKKSDIDLMRNYSTDLYQQGPRVYEVPKQKSNIVLVIVLGVILLLILGYVIYIMYNTMSRKMVCTSEDGDITLIYSKQGLTGYKSSTITYDIYEQRNHADEVGIYNYLDEFEQWFRSNTGGRCKR